MPSRNDATALRCPSAQPGMAEVQVLGVVSGSAEEPRISYLNEYVRASPELLQRAAPVAPTEVLRLAARCEERRCTHFDGERCQLAARIVAMLPEVTDALPSCIIRPACRWYAEEGRQACLRCPQVVTSNLTADAHLRKVAGGS
jgi:hypothetical protein